MCKAGTPPDPRYGADAPATLARRTRRSPKGERNPGDIPDPGVGLAAPFTFARRPR
jgi:hypothetical protein